MIVKQYSNSGTVLDDFQMYDLAAKQKNQMYHRKVRGMNP